MWHELIRINDCTYQLGRKYEDLLYTILDDARNEISSHKVVRWFKNGYLLSKAENYVEWESRDGVDLSYIDIIHTILNTELKEIYTIKNGEPDFKDFIQGFLILSHGSSYGVISEDGEVIIPFKFSEKEADHRLTLIRPLEKSSTKNIVDNAATKIIYKSRLTSIQDTTLTQKFISEINRQTLPEEKVYYLLLRRYSYAMKKKFSEKPKNALLPYDDAEFYLSKLDINTIISKIERITNQEKLSISYWDKYNLSHSTKYLIDDLQQYFFNENESPVIKRLAEIELLADALNIGKFNLEIFNEICKTKIPKIDTLNSTKMDYNDFLNLIKSN